MRFSAPAGAASAMVLTAALAAGCGAHSPEPTDTGLPYSRFRSLVDDALADAQGTASHAQIAILERAKVADEVTFDMVVEAVNNAGSCMEGVDAHVFWLEPDTSCGFPTPAYKYGADVDRPQSEWLPVAEDCLKRESGIVDWLYQTQPAVEGLKGAYYAQTVRPRVVACLEAHGVEVPEIANQADLDLLSADLWYETSGMVWVETDGGSEGTPTTPDKAVDCNAIGFGWITETPGPTASQ